MRKLLFALLLVSSAFAQSTILLMGAGAPGGGGGTITLLGHGSGHAANNSVGTPATSAAATCTGATMATVTVWAFDTADPATDAPITDSVGGNTYVAVSPTASSAFSVLESTTFRSSGTFHSGSSQTFTATPTTNSLFAITAACWAGPTTSDSNSGTAVFGNGTTCATGSTSGSGSPSLFLSIVTSNNAADAITPGGSFVLLDRIDAIGGTSVGGVTAWTTSSSAQSDTWNDNAGSNVVCATYSFK